VAYDLLIDPFVIGYELLSQNSHTGP